MRVEIKVEVEGVITVFGNGESVGQAVADLQDNAQAMNGNHWNAHKAALAIVTDCRDTLHPD